MHVSRHLFRGIMENLVIESFAVKICDNSMLMEISQEGMLRCRFSDIITVIYCYGMNRFHRTEKA